MAGKYPECFLKRLFGLSFTSMPVTLNLRIGEEVASRFLKRGKSHVSSFGASSETNVSPSGSRV